jgi:transposase
METRYRCCAAVDIHLRTFQVCVRRVGADDVVQELLREFGTTTRAILELADWLEDQGVQMVAMESTGVYWKPLWNLLEGRVAQMLINARHFRNVPGRKTDVSDSQWLADLLQHGLLRPSFVPARAQRQLRDLTRQRRLLVEERVRVVNRILKTLEDANIKLASVASDALGVSGRAMIRSLIAGEQDPIVLAELARQRLRSKIPQLREALLGRVNEHHRFMLQMAMEHLTHLEQHIATFEARIDAQTARDAEAIARLSEIPGIDRRVAQVLIAEIGTDMGRFPSAAHLCSWAKLCPGTHQSGGRRRNVHIGHGNRWLRATLVQAAWAASHAKGSYLGSQLRRLRARRGQKRALVAVAHSLLVIIYHMLKNGSRYRDLGAEHLDRLEPDRLTRSLVKRLQKLGHDVTLTPHPAAA